MLNNVLLTMAVARYQAVARLCLCYAYLCYRYTQSIRVVIPTFRVYLLHTRQHTRVIHVFQTTPRKLACKQQS